MAMQVGVQKEVKDREYRVGMTPAGMDELAITNNAPSGATPAGPPPAGAGGFQAWIAIDPPSTVTTLSGNACNAAPCPP